MKKSLKQRYISSAMLLMASTIIVKLISALYKIPLTAYIGAMGRGYFSVAYNLCMPIHAITMGAFPLALTKLVSSFEAKADNVKISKLRKASKKLFLIVGCVGMIIMLALAKPYCDIIASSPKSIYTVLALAPSVLFSTLAVCHRAFSEGFLDMKPTALSQLVEAVFKMVFGLIFASLTMTHLIEMYNNSNSVLGTIVTSEKEALAHIYPLTSASAMLGVTLGSIASYVVVKIIVGKKYSMYSRFKGNYKETYNELLTFSVGLVGATAVQSLANFFDSSTIQYCISLCNQDVLKTIYSTDVSDIFTYVFGIYAVALDFKNLVPAVVMALGLTAVPAVSSAYENSNENFSNILTSILKYTVIISCLGGLMLSLFSNEILSVVYGKTNADIVNNATQILFLFGITVLPCTLASTSVYCTQALGFSKATVLPFVISAFIRIALNFALITDSRINILGSAISNFLGFSVIVIMNLHTIKRKTQVKFNYLKILLLPCFCAVISFFITSFIKNQNIININSLFSLILYSIVCLFSYLILLSLTKCIDFKDIKLAKIM